MPWIEKRTEMINELAKNPGDYLFCHSDLNGCKMHLNSVAHRNSEKIDVDEFGKYKEVFSGHIHITQVNKNFKFIGSLWQMDRNDIGDQKGVTVLDLDSGKIHFEPNTHSPVFKKFSIKSETDMETLESIKNTKDYVDLSISNNLLINNRKLRRKLESMLEIGNFSSIDYIDDIIKEKSEVELKINEKEDSSISIHLDYEDAIKNYISEIKTDDQKTKEGIVKEFEEIIKIYNENYKVKSD